MLLVILRTGMKQVMRTVNVLGTINYRRDKMKIVYLYDGTPYMVYKNEEGEYQYPNDEWTEVSPPEGIYSPFYFNGNEWIGSTREEWLETLPKEEETENDKPDELDALNIQLIKNDLEHTKEIQALKQDIVNLTKQMLGSEGGKE